MCLYNGSQCYLVTNIFQNILIGVLQKKRSHVNVVLPQIRECDHSHLLIYYLDSGAAELPMIWIFPYFFESRILECFPSFSMLDYQVNERHIKLFVMIITTSLKEFCTLYLYSQVDYDNHALYKHGRTGRKQSPVRLFTNLCPKDIILPADEGYRYTKRNSVLSNSCI